MPAIDTPSAARQLADAGIDRKHAEAIATHTAQVLQIRQDDLATRADLNGVKTELAAVKADLGGVKTELAGVDRRLTGIESDLRWIMRIGGCAVAVLLILAGIAARYAALAALAAG